MIHLALKTLMQLIAITKEYLFQDNMLSNIIQIQTQLKQKKYEWLETSKATSVFFRSKIKNTVYSYKNVLDYNHILLLDV